MSARIPRDPHSAARERYDLIVVGGGIHGVMVALESARRGLRPLLLERSDFGAETTQNNLRIVHGGLRYLQRLDIPRHRESVRERRWLLANFPELVRPIACVMPLDGRGLRRGPVLRAALLADALLSPDRDRGLDPTHRLPAGEVLDLAALSKRAPAAVRTEHRGAALWHDAFMPDAPRLVIEALRWACAEGARALNYVEAVALRSEDGQVRGVEARDLESGQRLELRAQVVVNAAGPGCAAFAARCGAASPDLFHASLAWNVLFDRPPLSDGAVALTPPGARHTYFAVPWKGRLLAGTGHAARPAACHDPLALDADELAHFVAELNRAAPALDLSDADVLRIFAGLLPARRAGSAELSRRARIVDHGAEAGPRGLWSLSGVKFTTARRLAERLLERAFPGSSLASGEERSGEDRVRRERAPAIALAPDLDDPAGRDALRRLAADESVCHLDDLMLRRVALAEDPVRAAREAPRLCSLLDWDPERSHLEVARLLARLAPPGLGPGPSREGEAAA